MFNTFKNWFKIYSPHKSIFAKHLIFILAEILCYLFIPISFAKIISCISSQSPTSGYLWAGINFLVQLLGGLVRKIKQTFLKNLKNEIYKLSHQDNLCKFLITFDQTLLSLFKMTLIVFLSLIYSWTLAIYVFISFLLTSLLSILVQAKNKNLTLLVDLLWYLLTLLLTVKLISLSSNFNISLNSFLVLTSFINTHLLKPNFNNSFFKELKNLNLLNKNNNAWINVEFWQILRKNIKGEKYGTNQINKINC